MLADILKPRAASRFLGDTCEKLDGAAQNRPKECIKRVSEEPNKSKLNYILVGRLCNLESP